MLSEFMAYLWIGISLAAAAAEILTLKRTAIWFVISGMFAFFLSIFEIRVWIQVLCFIIISPTLILLSRVISKKSEKIRKFRNLVGKTAIVIEEIDNEKNKGSVRINGTAWTARAEYQDDLYENGVIVTVIKVDGGLLICSR